MDLGVPELIFIFLLALLLFGPKKLPEIGRQIGKFMAEFRRASNDFKSQINDEIRQMEVEEQQKKIAPPSPEGTVSATPALAAAASAESPASEPPPAVSTGSDSA
jgi:sec-independent protein translocase protein TatB